MKWLLLRGLARDARHWEDFPKIFEEHNPNTQTHVLDLPGFGTERTRKSPLSVKKITEDLRRRWLPLKQTSAEPWGILAISFGGMITMDWLNRYPSDFQNAVIINSSSGNTSPPHRRLSPFGMKSFLKIARSATASEKEEHILNFNSNIARLKDPEVHQRWTQMAEDQPLPTDNTVIQLTAAMRFNAPKTLPVRPLFISSQQDRLTHPRCTWELAHRFKAPVVFHHEAGHDIPLDAPEWLAIEINRWLTL